MKKLPFSNYWIRRITLCLVYFITLNSHGQSAFVKIERIFYDNSNEDFDSLEFVINGIHFNGMDTVARPIALNKKFDHCIAINGKDTWNFMAKFKANNTYVIRPGCCCAAFTIVPQDNPRRGTVMFQNKTNRDLGLVVATAGFDTVSMHTSKEVFSYESAMCLFQPCRIQLVETEYMNDKFNYSSDTLDYDSLWKEQANYSIDSRYFHFLHGEKIEIMYNEKLNSIKLKLIGYLTEEEYKRWWK